MARTTTRPQARRKIRSLRHWKQRFDKNASFIWRRDVQWDGKRSFKAGDEIPQDVLDEMGPTKLRRLWESHRIELAEFDIPNPRTGVVEKVPEPERPEGVVVTAIGGNWHSVTVDGGQPRKVRGAKGLQELMDSIEKGRRSGPELPELPDGFTLEETGADQWVAVADGYTSPFLDGTQAVVKFFEDLAVLAAAEAPPELPEGVSVESGGGGWFTVDAGEDYEPIKVQGQKALDELLEALRAELAGTAAEEDRATANLTDGD